MARKKPWVGSEVKLTVKLPRVVLPRGRVGHVLIHGRNMWDLMYGDSTLITEVACHKVDGYRVISPEVKLNYWRGNVVYWANKDHPTCRSCASALSSLVLT